MAIHRKVSKLTTLFLCTFIGCKATVDMTDGFCNLLPGCSCLLTSNKTYKYQCLSFTALLENNDLDIRCNLNQSTPFNDVGFTGSSLQSLTILECPLNLFLNKIDNFNTLRILTIKKCIKTGENDLQSLLKSLPNLYDLEINQYPIGLTGDMFNNNLAFKRLILSHNFIQWMPEDIFKNAIKLIHLDVSDNRIIALPDEIFFKLRSLKYLNLSMNKLKHINPTLFYNLQNLEEVDLSHNEINTIHSEAFQRLINLKVVNLGYNLVEFDGFSPFYSNLNLQRADLSHNKISHMVNDLVINKVYLDELNLSFNEISHIELSNLLTVSQYPKINLQNNKITSINFTNVYLLEQLNLIDNSDLVQKYHAVTMINLNDNPIICDCNLYDFIKFLHSGTKGMQFLLNRANCKSPTFLNGFPLTKLKQESLTCILQDDSCPSACSCNYRQWDRAIVLDCVKRNLLVVPDLRMLTHYNVQKIEVHLEDNLLTYGPPEQMGYENITKLFLSHNQIQNITWLPSNLEVLEMEFNNITALSFEVLQQINSSRLKSLVLGNNPWRCDCSAVSLNSLLITELTSKQIDVSKIQCSGTHKLLINLNSEDLCSSISTLPVIPLVISISLVGLSGVIIYIMIYISRKKMQLKRSRMV